MKINRNNPWLTASIALTDNEMESAFLEEQQKRDLETVKEFDIILTENGLDPQSDKVLHAIAERMRKEMDDDLDYKERTLHWVVESLMFEKELEQEKLEQARMVHNLRFIAENSGIRVIDRNQLDNGNYKTVARIEECGAYRLFGEVSKEAEKRIIEEAKSIAVGFRDAWGKLSVNKQVRMLDECAMNYDQFEEAGGYTVLCAMTSEERLGLLCEYMCENFGLTMPE